MPGSPPARSPRSILPESWCGRSTWRRIRRRSRSTGVTAVHRSSIRTKLILLCYHESASYLLALDSRTARSGGRLMPPAGVTSYSTPLVVETGGKAEIVVNSSAGVSGHDVATGERCGTSRKPIATPFPMQLFHDGLIYMSRGYRSSPFMAIRPGGKGTSSRVTCVESPVWCALHFVTRVLRRPHLHDRRRRRAHGRSTRKR